MPPIRPSLAVLLLALPVPAPAQPTATPSPRECALREDAPLEAAAAFATILAKIKARFPDAHILKIERTALDLEGRRLAYEIKVLPQDGRIVWLRFDARTLEQLQGDAAGRPERDCAPS
ncbi:PepSY domain-containing protein [Rhodopseudomonas palustris]|uniref:PepSY domain-containing protein n=1 Tax=Rhodopseudomonas palustris (strain BisB18) TaxID=316056 RepID=Q20YF1_RHOPB